jgi:hypothetical protein
MTDLLITSGKDDMPSWYDVLKSEEIEAIWLTFVPRSTSDDPLPAAGRPTIIKRLAMAARTGKLVQLFEPFPAW